MRNVKFNFQLAVPFFIFASTWNKKSFHLSVKVLLIDFSKNSSTFENVRMNTIDRRRRLGPSNAISLNFPIDSTIQDTSSSTLEQDKLFIQLSNIPTSTGSSFIQSGNNILLSSVYGPRPSFKRTFNSQAVVKISFHSSSYLLTNQDDIDSEYKIIESVILSTLETSCSNLILLDNYPKSTIDIFINLINIDYKTKFLNILSLIHNSVNLALIDSGIALKNFPTSIVTNDNIFINSIHSNVYNLDSTEDLQNEELLTFYIPKLPDDGLINIEDSFNNAIVNVRSLRSELSQFCSTKL